MTTNEIEFIDKLRSELVGGAAEANRRRTRVRRGGAAVAATAALGAGIATGLPGSDAGGPEKALAITTVGDQVKIEIEKSGAGIEEMNTELRDAGLSRVVVVPSELANGSAGGYSSAFTYIPGQGGNSLDPGAFQQYRVDGGEFAVVEIGGLEEPTMLPGSAPQPEGLREENISEVDATPFVFIYDPPQDQRRPEIVGGGRNRADQVRPAPKLDGMAPMDSPKPVTLENVANDSGELVDLQFTPASAG